MLQASGESGEGDTRLALRLEAEARADDPEEIEEEGEWGAGNGRVTSRRAHQWLLGRMRVIETLNG